ncbi:hypothetical protein [Hydrogenimonas sp.]
MFKEVLEPLQARGLLFKRFEPFSLKEIGSRKRIAVYHGVDTENRYTLVFFIEKKSRILQKEAKEWLALKAKIEAHYGYPIRQVVALVKAPLCSKAKALLEAEGWQILT